MEFILKCSLAERCGVHLGMRLYIDRCIAQAERIVWDLICFYFIPLPHGQLHTVFRVFLSLLLEGGCCCAGCLSCLKMVLTQCVMTF